MTRLEYFKNGLIPWRKSLYMETKEKGMAKWEVYGVVASAFLSSVPFWILIYRFFGL